MRPGRTIAIICIVCLTQVVGLAQGKAEPNRELQEVQRQHLVNAESHQVLAQKLLKEGVTQTSPAKIDQAKAELERATQEYLVYASFYRSPEDVATIYWAAVGLLRCQQAETAIKLILEHPELRSDATIMHIKADALLALGSGEEAGLAYEDWIAGGKCSGLYRGWPSEFRFGASLFSKKDPSDLCAHLSPELRGRLEALRRQFGHPNNLPSKNYPSSPLDAL